MKGFETHTHKEVEIVSYCLQGTLAHKDGLGVENQLSVGDSQYTCTGTGITHSEMNDCPDEMLRFIQIWIRPIKLHLRPHYKLKKLLPAKDDGFFHLVASGKKTDGALHIAQDANILSARPDKGQCLQYRNANCRQSYMVVLEGNLRVNEFSLYMHDAMKIRGEETLHFTAIENSLLLIVEMASE